MKSCRSCLFAAVCLATLACAFAKDKEGTCPAPLAPRSNQQGQQGRAQQGSTSGGGSGCEIACSKDNDCSNNLKCCSNYCGGRSCTTPVYANQQPNNKPGWCPANVIQSGRCREDCKRDNDCRGNNKCCRTTCGGAQCTEPLTTSTTTTTTRRPHNEKPGTCTPGLAQFSCATECQRDQDCRSDLKCCPTVCGGKMCSAPRETIHTTTRRPGSGGARPGCPRPSEHPGEYTCRSNCSNDSDCRGNKKCCANQCGAMVCTVRQ